MSFKFSSLFYPVFFLLYILSFFLIEGEHKFYLFGLWSVFIWVFSHHFFIKNGKALHGRPTTLAMIMVALFTINLFFSISIPLTIEKLLLYLIALALFVFFLNFARDRSRLPTFFSYLALSSLVLNVFVLFFTFVPPPPLSFPGMNILVRIFGHNYYVSYLLLVLPVFWWQFLFAAKQSFAKWSEWRFLTILLILSSYLLMIFSLSRLSIFVGFVQLLLIFWFNKKSFIELLHNQFAYAALRAFSLILLLITIIFLSLPIIFAQEEACPVNFSYKEMCKPIFKNDRFQYWQKAFWVWQERPLFGSGLKTFAFSSKYFVLENYNFSSYAHNNFIHNLAEGGLITGGFFIFFILYLLSRSYLVMRRSREPLDQFLLLAVIASLANAMFDLTFNFFVIFSLTLIFIAIILSGESEKVQTSRLYPKLLTLLTVITVLLAGANFLASWLIRSNQVDQFVRLFPFFDQKVRSLTLSKRLTKANYIDLYSFYRLDPGFIYNFSQLPELDQAKKVQLLVELGELDPEFLVNKIDLEGMPATTTKPLADQFIRVVATHQMLDNTYFLDYWRQLNLAVDLVNLADRAYLAGELIMAADFYHQALLLNQYVLQDRQPAFLTESNLDQTAIFLAAFQKDINPEQMGNFYEYVGLYHQTLLHLFKQGRLAEFHYLTESLLAVLPGHAWFLIKDLTEVSQAEGLEANLAEVRQKLNYLPAWQEF